jgi:nucleoside-triphosphatase THEP1
MIWILTGPIGSGKTTKLNMWASRKGDVSGVLMPVREGRRYIHSLRTGEERCVEAGDEVFPDPEILRIGKYRFLKPVFDWGEGEILSGLPGKDTIVIDEIGPMELNGDGFAAVLRKTLEHREFLGSRTLVLVVREGLAEEAARSFRMMNYGMVTDPSEIG